jgi:hypothetical protein
MEEYYKIWKLKNPNYFKEYRLKNKERLDNYHEDWVKNNYEKVKKYNKEYLRKYNKEKKLKELNKKIEVFKATLLMSNLESSDINP